ncbi:MAG: POTRA domain-containing protein [Myxococcota bacterium]
MRILLALLALVATPAIAEPESHCRVETGTTGATLELTLRGVEDPEFEERCQILARLLAPLPATLSSTDAKTASALLLETTYVRAADCVPEASTLRCALTPSEMVAESEVEGALPFVLLKSDINRRIFLAPGVLLPDAAAAFATQKRRLETYLEQEGYFGSTATVRSTTVTGAEPNLSRSITVAVETGTALSLRTVRVSGSPILTEDDLGLLRRHWLLAFIERRFTPTAFEEAVDTMTDRLRARGWPEAIIRAKTHLDLPAEAVDVDLEVESGPRIELIFVGNRALSDEDLAKLTTFAKAGSVDPQEIEATAAAIRRKYQEKGYYDVKVRADTVSAKKDLAKLSFQIEEGPRGFVRALELIGNAHVETAELEKRIDFYTRPAGLIVSGAWVERWAARDAGEIVALYGKRGYGATHVEYSRRVEADGSLIAVFNVIEGPRRTVGRTTIEGLPPEIDARALTARLLLTDGAPYADASLAPDRREIVAAMAAAGYPRAEVHRRLKAPYKDQEGAAEIRYSVDPGVPASYGGLLIQGNLRTRASVIEDQLGLSLGEPLSSRKLAEAKRRLRNLGVFGTVELRPVGLTREKKETLVLVSVEERARRNLFLALSFSTDDYFSVGADYLDRNLLGRAISLDVSARLANASEVLTTLKIGQRDRISLRLRAPRIFGSGFDVETQGFYDLVNRPEIFKERRVGASIALLRTILDRTACTGCPSLIASLAYELTATETTIAPGIDGTTLGLASDAPATFGRLIPKLSLDTRDSFVDPRVGVFAETSFEIASPVFAGPFYDGARSFWRYLISAKAYLPLGAPLELRLDDGSTIGGPFVLAVAARYGVAHPYGTRQADQAPVPLSETFAYGGDVSVRGLDDSASKLGFPGANYLFTGSAELRWYVLQNFGFGTIELAGFVDFGAVSYHLGDLFRSVTLSSGPVLRYVTPIGPLAVAYGFPLIRAAEIVAANPDVIPIHGRLHISFGATF